MKRLTAALLCAALLSGSAAAAEQPADAPQVEAKAAILMEQETGEVLCQQNAHDKLEPASVTKIMTLLLVMEAIDGGQLSTGDTVTVSAHAASMGGSQVYLKEGEQMTVDDLLKAVAVVSGNDAAVALAEHIAGSEEAFVSRMNQRASSTAPGSPPPGTLPPPMTSPSCPAPSSATRISASTPPSGWTPSGADSSSCPTPTGWSASTPAAPG